MAWVAFDQAARAVQEHGLPGDAAEFRRLAHQVRDEVCMNGFDAGLETFVKYYGSRELDASLLLIPLVGFPASQRPPGGRPVDAIADTLTEDRLVLRYRTDAVTTDRLHGGEGTFLLCSFWLYRAGLGQRGDTARSDSLVRS